MIWKNPIPYNPAGMSLPLERQPPSNLLPANKLEILVDADVFIYQCGFAIEHTIYMVYDKDGFLLHQTDRKSKLNAWLKESGLAPEEYELDSYDEEEPLDNAFLLLNKVRKRIQEVTGSRKLRWYLTEGSTVFRNEYARIQVYKGNRADSRKPKHYDELRDYMKRRFKAKILDGIEADDGVAHLARTYAGKVVIVSADKDLRTIPGLYMNPSNMDDGVVYISPYDACKNFYTQMLTGDTVDNIKGLKGTKEHPGIGPKTAEKLLGNCLSEDEMVEVVANEYRARLPDGYVLEDGTTLQWWEVMEETANLLFLRKDKDMMFKWEQE